MAWGGVEELDVRDKARVRHGRPGDRRPRKRATRRDVRRRRLATVVALGLLAGGAVLVTTRGSDSPQATPPASAAVAARAARSAGARRPVLHAAAARHVRVTAPSGGSTSWTTVAWVHGRPAAWIAQRSAVTLMRFDQDLVHLTLHAGSTDGGVVGWTCGDQISRREIHLVVAAFNGAFRLTYQNVGFMSGGHYAVALKAGLASLVTYANGRSDIGAWQDGVPGPGAKVFSVLQNQQLLVDHGVAAGTVNGCVIACWGETIQGLTAVARSGLGITASGQLVWAAGEALSPSGLAGALIGAGVVRALELDINPDWVAGYLYVHHASGPAAVPVIPGQLGIAGQLLAPYSRDFLAVVAN
jgi:hypothetical protein